MSEDKRKKVNKGKRLKKAKKPQAANSKPASTAASVVPEGGLDPGTGTSGVPPHDPEVDKVDKKGKKKPAKEKPAKEVVIPPIGVVPKTKIDTKAFEKLKCTCCSKPLWAKDQLTGALIPGCVCGLYQPGHAKCERCNLHCECEGRTHG